MIIALVVILLLQIKIEPYYFTSVLEIEFFFSFLLSTKWQIKLNSAIVFKIEVENCGFYYINEKYNIYAFGETQEEVENNLFDAFMDQYESYALEKDENLTEKSLILKDNLLKIFGGIECLD